MARDILTDLDVYKRQEQLSLNICDSHFLLNTKEVFFQKMTPYFRQVLELF